MILLSSSCLLTDQYFFTWVQLTRKIDLLCEIEIGFGPSQGNDGLLFGLKNCIFDLYCYSWAMTMTSQDWGERFHRPEEFIVSNLQRRLSKFGLNSILPENVSLLHPHQIVGNHRAQSTSQDQDEDNVCPLDIEEPRSLWTTSEHPPAGRGNHW